MDTSDERRVSVRMPFVSEVFCQVHEVNNKYGGMLRDISITGLFMELSDCPDVGHHCDIEIIFQGKYSRLVIEKVGGVIVRSSENGVGVRFDERLEWFVLIPLYFHKLHD